MTQSFPSQPLSLPNRDAGFQHRLRRHLLDQGGRLVQGRPSLPVLDHQHHLMPDDDARHLALMNAGTARIPIRLALIGRVGRDHLTPEPVTRSGPVTATYYALHRRDPQMVLTLHSGMALGYDEIWRPHAWLVQPETDTLIELTTRCERYLGLELPDQVQAGEPGSRAFLDRHLPPEVRGQLTRARATEMRARFGPATLQGMMN